MAAIQLTIRQFNELVKYLKRLDDIGDDFFLKNDIIIPSIREPKNIPGKHVVRGEIPILPEYRSIVYGISKLSETSKILGDVKGKKQVLFLEENEKGIWVTVNDTTLQLAGVYKENDDLTYAPTEEAFSDFIVNKGWATIPTSILQCVKQGHPYTMEADDHTTYVRIARDLFKLRGVSRTKDPVNFSANVHIVSPLSSPERIVINQGSFGTLELHVIYNVIECVHQYLFSPFH